MARGRRFFTQSWIKFRLLMWKNFLQQWRHRIQTATELFLPVLTMSVVLILRWQIEPWEIDKISYQPLLANTLVDSGWSISGMNTAAWTLAYSPTSPVLEDVLKSATANLLIENLDVLIHYLQNDEVLPPHIHPVENRTEIEEILRNLIRIEAYDRSEDLADLYALEETTRTVIAAVEFDNGLYGAEELPVNLSYALRFPERPRLYSFWGFGVRTWRTDAVLPAFDSPGPRYGFIPNGGSDPGYVYEMFIAFQHAISSELVSRVTGLDLQSYKVYLQRYSHPPYVQDNAVDILRYIFPLFIVLSFSYTAVNIVRAITVEKELQLKELMKIMGLPTWLHWFTWFCKQFIFQIVAAILIVILLKVQLFTNDAGFSEYAVFTNTPWSVLFFFVILYLCGMIFFCFMISGFFSKGSTAALFAGVLWFLAYLPAILLSVEVEVSIAVQVITCLSINTAMSYGFQLLMARESTGGLQWGAFMSSPTTNTSRFVFGHVIIMMVVDCVLYMLITLYLEQIHPGPFGAPKPWNFLFKAQFWCPGRKSEVDVVVNGDGGNTNIIQEKDPEGHSIGVKMHNLTKAFGDNLAVNNLNMNIYDDQITVLLGHNGAGKSTTISMLTGNLKVTNGTINVAGYDMSTQAASARAHIGLCSQHNILFNELTVKEHLEFFARLKGFTGPELAADINTLIEKLELQEKTNSPSKDLSGGQKRRLCIGIALAGRAKVVLLDEPTSGMDPAARRGLWELLQKEKKGRSMILTTHFMDEADILGDRVAIMAEGKLQCLGSPYFLKRHYGMGYTLVIGKDEGFDHRKCTALINRYIPDTKIKEDRGSELTYNLGNEYSHIFENMLSELERNATYIKFQNYGLVATTLEDIFMSVGSDMAPVNLDADSDDVANGKGKIDHAADETYRHINSSLEQLDSDDSSVTGRALLIQQVCAVWLKLLLVWKRSWWVVLMQLLVPILIIVGTLALEQFVSNFTDSIENRLLALTDGYTRTETLLSYNGTSTSSLGALAASAYQMMFETSGVDGMELTNVGAQYTDEYYLNRTADPADMGRLRNQLLIGSTFSEEFVTAWFSNFGYHDVAVTLSAVHSALLKSVNPDASLTVSNHPLETTYEDQTNTQIMETLSMQLASAIGNSVSIVSAIFVMFYIKERVSGAKLLQKAAGVPPAVLWGSAAVFDWLWFLISCISIIIACAAFQVVGVSTAVELGRMYLCVMVYGAAMLPLTYLLSLVFKGPGIGFVSFFFINLLFGAVGSQVVELLIIVGENAKRVAEILDTILQFFPLYSLVSTVSILNKIGLKEQTCLQMCVLIPDSECTINAVCELDPDCCDDTFFQWKDPGALRYIVCMIISCVIFWTLLMIIEYRLLQKVFVFKKTPPPVDVSSLDKDVAAEVKQIRQISPQNYSHQSLLTKDLTKYYGKNLAVNQVSFRLSDGECFGLLGVNGSGKTTTFKMLMGDEAISNGEAYVSGHSVQRNINKVHENIGYCPQFDALFHELTGRETLRVFALMRGLPTHNIMSSIVALAHALGFYKHLNKRVHQYSGGTKRKLNTAVAFLGKTRLMFVDEPTTGIDPAAKRHMWRAMRGVQLAGRGVVLSSHSMEECEALCSKLTIMVNGGFQCLGTPQHLKNKFSQGFTLTIKLKAENIQNSQRTLVRQTSLLATTAAVKDYVRSNFTNPRIMEEYQGLLTYYLPDRIIPWSKMFGIMEHAKRELNIEDYTITQTTLEQIFLQFTKYQEVGDLETTETPLADLTEVTARL